VGACGACPGGAGAPGGGGIGAGKLALGIPSMFSILILGGYKNSYKTVIKRF
jgi:hypothetical protein